MEDFTEYALEESNGKALLVSQATYGYLTYNLTNNNLYFKVAHPLFITKYEVSQLKIVNIYIHTYVNIYGFQLTLPHTNECCNHLTQRYVQEK